MTESEKIKEVVNQVAIHAAMVVMMALSDAEVGLQPTMAASQKEW